jgi:hypothetical protein
VFENRVLRGVFGSERKKVSRGRGNLYNKLHNLHSSLKYSYNDQIKEDEMGGAFILHRRQVK